MEINFPISYTQNNDRELEVLKRADNFLRQFCYLYPAKPEPPLVFENECKVRKLSCTTLCPSRIAKTISLNEWENSAQFLADYVEYKLTRFPQEAPHQLFSLDAILKRREGNSLEMSMLLCSFLLSSSYDAFVVQGYATQAVTEKLQKSASNPLDHISEKFKHYAELYRQREIKKQGKYNFDFYAAKKYWMENRRDPKEIKTEIIPEETEAEIIPQETKTEILPQKTKTEIIPGGIKTEIFPMEMNGERILEDTKTEIIPEEFGEITYEKRIHFWVLLRSSENKKIFIEASTGESFLIEDSNYLGVEFLWNNKNFWYYKGEQKDSCKHINFDLLEGREWGQFLPTFVINNSETDYSQIRMPDTWVRELEITQEQYENRFHRDGKHIRYKMAVAMKYNGDCLKTGLVHKITYCKEGTYEVPEKVLTFFEGRQDKLLHRMVDCNVMIAKDMFSKGREDAIKEHNYSLKENPEFIQTIKFYSDLREDNLHSKEWNNKWVKEIFVGRIDRLNYREIVYHDQNIFEDKENLNKEKQDEYLPDDNKEKETLNIKYHIVPSMFDTFQILFEDIEFSQLDMHTFLQVIDPAERYASTDTDSENEVNELQKSSHENIREKDRENISQAGGVKLKKSLESVEENLRNGANKEPPDFVKQDIKDDVNVGTDQTSLVKDIGGEFEDNVREQNTHDSDDAEIKHYASQKITFESEEMEAKKYVSQERIFRNDSKKENKVKKIDPIGDINVDDLSDEELQTNYKLYLFSLWEEFSNEDKMDLFFMREFDTGSDLEKNTLEAKRKIIRKRRKNMRHQQRLEYGKPAVRVHKKKLDEDIDEKSFYATDIANSFRLNEKFPGYNFASLQEFEPSMDILNEFCNHAKAEIVEKECLKIYDTNLKQVRDVDKIKKTTRIVRYKKSFSLDPAVPEGHSIKEVWYLPETSSFRIDFHYPEGKSGGRKLLFTKPTSKSTAFKFRDYLFRQVTPSYETEKVSKSRLYSYLVSLLKEEPVVLKELELFEKDMKTLLARREVEIRDISEAL